LSYGHRRSPFRARRIGRGDKDTSRFPSRAASSKITSLAAPRPQEIIMAPYRFAAALLLVPILAVSARACTIPVFRYALERWELTAYEIVIYHKEPLADDAKALLKKIEDGPPVANLRVETADLTKDLSKAYKGLYEKYGKGQPLPWVAVRLVDADPSVPPAWTGPLKGEALQAVVSSPIRLKIVDRLKTGESAVFLFLESGDKALDDPARSLLEKELTRMAKAIQLPEQSAEGPQLRTGLPLKVGFSVLPMKRDDPAEQAFLKIIMNTEEDLEKVKGPIVLPVFGRGRLLCSLYSRDINATQIANVTRFLCGECSCQVKELNPGVDLLIPADWRELLEKAGPPTTPRPDTPAPKKKTK
jgi:hypothetical protein